MYGHDDRALRVEAGQLAPCVQGHLAISAAGRKREVNRRRAHGARGGQGIGSGVGRWRGAGGAGRWAGQGRAASCCCRQGGGEIDVRRQDYVESKRGGHPGNSRRTTHRLEHLHVAGPQRDPRKDVAGSCQRAVASSPCPSNGSGPGLGAGAPAGNKRAAFASAACRQAPARAGMFRRATQRDGARARDVLLRAGDVQ